MSYFKTRNLLLVLAVCLALFLAVVIALRFHPEDSLPAVVKALPEGVDVSLRDIDYTQVEEGHARWRLVAQQAERQSASGLMVLDSPSLSFYDEKGGVESSVEAERGEVSDDYQKVGLHGDVVLKNSGGYTVYTDQLDYDHAQQVVTTAAHVRLVADGVSLEGSGLVLDLKQERMRLNADVKGSLE